MCFYVSRSVGTPDMLRLHVSTYVVIDILRIHEQPMSPFKKMTKDDGEGLRVIRKDDV